jgi:NAD-dependent dihydropyrimidine dehydrogenase PreA subunit
MPLRYLKNVVTLKYDLAKCTGCGRCLEVCPHAVFAMDGDKAILSDRDACMECGACSRNCAYGAISVRAGVGCAWAIVRSKLNKSDVACCG